MGFKTELNWVLKLNDFSGTLEPDKTYDFRKREARVYPIGMPVFLASKDWEILAAVMITESTVKGGETSGKFRVMRICRPEEKEVLTRMYRELYG